MATASAVLQKTAGSSRHMTRSSTAGAGLGKRQGSTCTYDIFINSEIRVRIHAFALLAYAFVLGIVYGHRKAQSQSHSHANEKDSIRTIGRWYLGKQARAGQWPAQTDLR